MNRIKTQKKGLSNIDLFKLREIAKTEARKMQTEATEKAFLYMLAIPLNVLVSDNWSKSAKTKAPKFIKDVISLYESVQEGAVTDKELQQLLLEYSGVNIEAEWLGVKE